MTDEEAQESLLAGVMCGAIGNWNPEVGIQMMAVCRSVNVHVGFVKELEGIARAHGCPENVIAGAYAMRDEIVLEYPELIERAKAAQRGAAERNN